MLQNRALVIVLLGTSTPAGVLSEVPTTSEVLGRYPKAGANRSAMQLSELAERLGCGRLLDSDGELESSERSDDRRRTERELREYLSARLGDLTSGRVDPPASIQALLRGRSKELRAVRDHLLVEPLPRWPFDLEALPPQARVVMADVSAVRRIHDLLMARALTAERSDDGDPLSWIVAARRLSDSLLALPLWFTRVWATWLARTEAAVVRTLNGGTSTAIELPDMDELRSAIEESFAVESWWMIRTASELRRGGIKVVDVIGEVYSRETDDSSGWFDRSLERIESLARWATTTAPTRAYWVTEMRASSRRMAGLVDEYRKLDLCELTRNHIALRSWSSLPWWSTGIFDMNPDGMWANLGRHLLEIELTGKVIQLREERRRTGRWPDSLPAIESCSCAARVWRYDKTDDGGVRIRLTPPLDAGSDNRDGNPIEWSSAPANFSLPR